MKNLKDIGLVVLVIFVIGLLSSTIYLALAKCSKKSEQSEHPGIIELKEYWKSDNGFMRLNKEEKLPVTQSMLDISEQQKMYAPIGEDSTKESPSTLEPEPIPEPIPALGQNYIVLKTDNDEVINDIFTEFNLTYPSHKNKGAKIKKIKDRKSMIYTRLEFFTIPDLTGVSINYGNKVKLPGEEGYGSEDEFEGMSLWMDSGNTINLDEFLS